MANTQLFQNLKGKFLPFATSANEEASPAYAMTPRHQLAQYAATGCLNATYYASAEVQLATVLESCEQVDAKFIAQTAIYCRERGYMKDVPALLVAVLAAKGAAELGPAFKRVINNGKMLRNFVQTIRSGALGRKSLGTRPKKLIQTWLNGASEKALLSAAVGNAPSLADVVKMVRPKPAEAWREAFFAWLIGKPYNAGALPCGRQGFRGLQAGPGAAYVGCAVPDADRAGSVGPRMGATGVPRGWQMVRMNLNTFVGGFSDEVFKIIAAFAAGLVGAQHWVGAIDSIDGQEVSWAG